jgi:hypothetical protein
MTFGNGGTGVSPVMSGEDARPSSENKRHYQTV